LFDLLSRLGDNGCFFDNPGGRKDKVDGFGGTCNTANDVTGGDFMGKDTLWVGVGEGNASSGEDGMASGIGVRKAGGVDGASITVTSRNCDLGTSGHENNGKDNELIHGDV